MISSPVSKVPNASLIVEHSVPRGKGLAFRLWHANLTRSAKGFEGFIRCDRDSKSLPL